MGLCPLLSGRIPPCKKERSSYGPPCALWHAEAGNQRARHSTHQRVFYSARTGATAVRAYVKKKRATNGERRTHGTHTHTTCTHTHTRRRRRATARGWTTPYFSRAVGPLADDNMSGLRVYYGGLFARAAAVLLCAPAAAAIRTSACSHPRVVACLAVICGPSYVVWRPPPSTLRHRLSASHRPGQR